MKRVGLIAGFFDEISITGSDNLAGIHLGNQYGFEQRQLTARGSTRIVNSGAIVFFGAS
jgi:hypothetical protein